MPPGMAAVAALGVEMGLEAATARPPCAQSMLQEADQLFHRITPLVVARVRRGSDAIIMRVRRVISVSVAIVWFLILRKAAIRATACDGSNSSSPCGASHC